MAGKARSAAGDHPRGCGEHIGIGISGLRRQGSSPRMRGALNAFAPAWTASRIIPADAGSTLLIQHRITRKRDHSRGCGEHHRAGQRHHDIQGSSRGCGEHAGRKGNKVLRQGSSPRMRGAPGEHRHRLPLIGIIPADAGSTVCLVFSCLTSADHPRGCGEHLLTAHATFEQIGSSPRMRGAQTCTDCQPWRVWIIPADAGSTAEIYQETYGKVDHPRGCGEHSPRIWKTDTAEGSSPRMRGALVIAGRRRDRPRIIPADAGSTR